jgi:hypothetical protein
MFESVLSRRSMFAITIDQELKHAKTTDYVIGSFHLEADPVGPISYSS